MDDQPLCDPVTTKHTADVLVLGGGLSGACAAFAAVMAGSERPGGELATNKKTSKATAKPQIRVVLVSKKPLGEGGNSSRASGGFAAPLQMNDNPTLFEQDLLQGGRAINDLRQVARLARRAGADVRILDELIGGFARDSNGLAGFPVPAHSLPRSTQYTKGMSSFMLKFRTVLQNLGVELFESHQAISLLNDRDGAVTGALLLDQEESPVSISSTTTVLATGGGGALFPVSTNSEDVTCCGIAMALKAGAELVDMEFVQFTPTAFAAPPQMRGQTIVGSLLSLDGVTLLNSLDQRFMSTIDAERMEAADRAILARAIYREVQEGRGSAAGGVYLDLRQVSVEVINRQRPGFVDLCLSVGIDVTKDLLETAPSAHTVLGGVKLQDDFSVKPGLFAAGEVVGGVHGANRLSSTSLTDAGVGGFHAGELAAYEAIKKKSTQTCKQSSLGQNAVGQVLSGVVCPFARHFSHSGKTLEISAQVLNQKKQELQLLMADCVGLERTEIELKRAEKWILDELVGEERMLTDDTGEDLGDEGGAVCPDTCMASSHALPSARTWFEYHHLLVTAHSIVKSARYRKESRGAHYRTDYPLPSDDWIGNNCVYGTAARLQVVFIPAKIS